MKQERMAEGEPAPVPPAVLDCLEAEQGTALTNMLNIGGVVEIAKSMRHPETASWIRRNPAPYALGVFWGFSTEGADT